jgi:hypothetical protein
MKKRIVINNGRARLLAMSLALGAGMTILGGATVALAADNNQEDSSRFTEKMKNWQENMSETFRDTWKGLWHDKDAKSLSESSNRDGLGRSAGTTEQLYRSPEFAGSQSR